MQQLHLKDDPSKKSTTPTKSVMNFLLKSFLKRDSYASDSNKKKKLLT